MTKQISSQQNRVKEVTDEDLDRYADVYADWRDLDIPEDKEVFHDYIPASSSQYCTSSAGETVQKTSQKKMNMMDLIHFKLDQSAAARSCPRNATEVSRSKSDDDDDYSIVSDVESIISTASGWGLL